MTAALLSLPTVVVVGGAVRVGAAGLVPVIQGALVVAAAAGALALLQVLGAAESRLAATARRRACGDRPRRCRPREPSGSRPAGTAT